jgi:glycerol-3-phosphate acyltransferase PlsY
MSGAILPVLLRLAAAYLLGGVMGGDLMRLLRGGEDLRKTGSGNVGATNALRSRGAAFAIGVLVIDIGKGVVAALVLPALPWLPAAPELQPWLPYACGLAAALGHCYPAVHGFKGGKGVATAVGVFGALLPAALPWMIGTFALTVMLSGYVSLASLCGAAVAVGFTALFGDGIASKAGAFALAMAALVVVKHRHNILRLLDGSESRFEKVMVLRRRPIAPPEGRND